MKTIVSQTFLFNLFGVKYFNKIAIMKLIQRYKKIISILGLCAYLFTAGYSLCHYHSAYYLVDESYDTPQGAAQISKFHNESFCLLYHFNSTQLYSDLNPFFHFAPAKLNIIENSSASPLISSEINSIPKRGPPSLS